jgi:hypothetical protein
MKGIKPVTFTGVRQRYPRVGIVGSSRNRRHPIRVSTRLSASPTENNTQARQEEVSRLQPDSDPAESASSEEAVSEQLQLNVNECHSLDPENHEMAMHSELPSLTSGKYAADPGCLTRLQRPQRFQRLTCPS